VGETPERVAHRVAGTAAGKRHRRWLLDATCQRHGEGDPPDADGQERDADGKRPVDAQLTREEEERGVDGEKQAAADVAHGVPEAGDARQVLGTRHVGQQAAVEAERQV
jgi:hypothetical protein